VPVEGVKDIVEKRAADNVPAVETPPLANMGATPADHPAEPQPPVAIPRPMTERAEPGIPDRRVSAGAPPDGIERRGAIVSETPPTGPGGKEEQFKGEREQKRAAERLAQADPFGVDGRTLYNQRSWLDAEKGLNAAAARRPKGTAPNRGVTAGDFNDFGIHNKRVGQAEGDKILIEGYSQAYDIAKRIDPTADVFRAGNGDEVRAVGDPSKSQAIADAWNKEITVKREGFDDVTLSAGHGDTPVEADLLMQRNKQAFKARRAGEDTKTLPPVEEEAYNTFHKEVTTDPELARLYKEITSDREPNEATLAAFRERSKERGISNADTEAFVTEARNPRTPASLENATGIAGTIREGTGRSEQSPVGERPQNVASDSAPGTVHKFSSTQVDLPNEHAKAVRALGRTIPQSDLAGDGRETEPHITVKYGLHTADAEKVRSILADQGPIEATIGKTSMFKGVEDGTADAVIAEVDSPDLHRLNKLIAEALPHTDTHPEYKPHITVAYVKPGLGEKYSGRSDLEGRTVTLKELTFSGKNGETVTIPLGGKGESVDAQHGQPEGGSKERALPKTLAAGGLEPGTNKTYEPQSLSIAEERGRAILKEKGVDGAMEFARGSEASAESTVAGFAAIRELQDRAAELASDTKTVGESEALMQKAADFASEFAEKMTRTGQAINAVKAIEMFSPDRQLYIATKMAKSVRKGKGLTAEEATRITGNAEQLDGALKRVKHLEGLIAELDAERRANDPFKAASAAAGKKGKPVSLLTAIRNAGGIHESESDIAVHFSNKEGSTTGLITKDGKSVEDMVDHLREAGFILPGYGPWGEKTRLNAYDRSAPNPWDSLSEAMRLEAAGKGPGRYEDIENAERPDRPPKEKTNYEGRLKRQADVAFEALRGKLGSINLKPMEHRAEGGFVRIGKDAQRGLFDEPTVESRPATKAEPEPVAKAPVWAEPGTSKVVDGHTLWQGRFGAKGEWAVAEGEKLASNYRKTAEEAIADYQKRQSATEDGAARKGRAQEVNERVKAGDYTDADIQNLTGRGSNASTSMMEGILLDLGVRSTDARAVIKTVPEEYSTASGTNVFDVRKVIEKARKKGFLSEAKGEEAKPEPAPKPITGLAKTIGDAGRTLQHGTLLSFTDGEYAGKTGKVEGVIASRYKKGETTYRIQIDGFPKPGGWNGKITATADQLMKTASEMEAPTIERASPSAETSKEPWQMTRREYASQERATKFEAIQKALKEGKPIDLPSHRGTTRITKPEHLRLGKTGVEIQQGSKWLSLTEDSVDTLAEQAGMKIPRPSERVYHDDLVAAAAREGKSIPDNVRAEYPDLPKGGKLDFGNLARPGERGSIGERGGPLPGDAELIAQYGAASLGKVDLSIWTKDILNAVPEAEPYLKDIRRRAYEIYAEEKRADTIDRLADMKTRPTAAQEIASEVREANKTLKEAESVEARNLEKERKAQVKAAKQAADAAVEADRVERARVAKEARSQLREARKSLAEAERANQLGAGEEARQRLFKEQESVKEIVQKVREAERAQTRQEEMSIRQKARETAKAVGESSQAEARSQAEEARQRLKEAQETAREANKARQKGYRSDIKAQREAERTTKLWDTPIRNEATAARERLTTATPDSPQTIEDLVHVATGMLLPEKPGGPPRSRVLSTSKFYHDLKQQFPELVNRKNKGQIFKQAFQRVEDAKAAAREAAAIHGATKGQAAAMTDSQVMGLRIQKARAEREAFESRSAQAREFRRLSRSTIGRVFHEAQAAPRALKSSIDAPLGRQGLFYLVTHPIKTLREGRTIEGYKANPERFAQLQKELQQHPDHELGQQAGLDLVGLSTEVDPRYASEEAFQSELVANLPHIRRSEQAYNLAMNQQRISMFSRYADAGRLKGYTFESNPEFFKQVAHIVNSATGRGNLGPKLKSYANAANHLLFSGRLQISRVQLINDLVNPVKYWNYDPATRRIAATELLRFAGGMGALFAGAAAMGAKVTSDPDDADFGKAVFGKTHVDLTGGMGGFTRQIYRMMRSLEKTATGQPQADNDRFFEVLKNFGRSKLAPVPGAAVNLITGTDVRGKEATLGMPKEKGVSAFLDQNQLIQMVVPMIANDLIDAATEDGWVGVAKAAPAFAGFGLGTYKGTPEVSKFYRELDLTGQKAKTPGGQTKADAKAHGVLTKAAQVLGELKKQRDAATSVSWKDKLIDAMNRTAADAMVDAKAEYGKLGARGEKLQPKRKTTRSVERAVREALRR